MKKDANITLRTSLKMKTTITKSFLGIGFLAISLLLSSCMADLRSPMLKKEGLSQSNVDKGRAILQEAWEKQGFNHLAKFKTYAAKGQDRWKGMLGKMGKVWPEAKSSLELKYAIGTFDGRVSFLDGKRKGEQAGLQSWKYYEVDENGTTEFMKRNVRIRFGLAAYQYFFELGDRMMKAPIVSYSGEKEFRGKQYDQVFVSWHKAKAHKQNDQYLLWINKETKMIEFSTYTLRDNYLPMPGGRALFGSIEYGDFRNVQGVMIPHLHSIYINNPKKKNSKFLHKMKVSNFQFDAFELDELYPNKSLKRLGDTKDVVSID